LDEFNNKDGLQFIDCSHPCFVIMDGNMGNSRRAYSLVELIIVAVFLGIFAAIAVPRINFAIITKQKSDTIARKIVTDLRRTRTLAISDAADNSEGFALNMTGTSPYSGYEIENIDTLEVVDTHTIPSGISCTGGDEFKFGPLGNLLTGSDTELTVSGEGRSFTVSVITATGMVKCVEN
jgi:Tfp pilus assembly protein FimT